MLKTSLAARYGERKAIIVHQTELLEDEAKLAMTMIEKWGMVMAIPDGEDSAGRQKLRIATPAELVKRAFETAALAMKHTRKSKLIHISIDPVLDEEKGL